MIVSKVVQKIDSYNYKCMESVPCLYSNISLWWYLNTYVAFTICICIFWRKRIYTPYFLQLTHELNFISLKLAVQVLLNPSKPPTKVLLGISTYIHIQLLFTPFQNLNNICLEVFYFKWSILVKIRMNIYREGGMTYFLLKPWTFSRRIATFLGNFYSMERLHGLKSGEACALMFHRFCPPWTFTTSVIIEEMI